MFANRGSATVYHVSDFEDERDRELLTDLVALFLPRPPRLLLQSARHGEKPCLFVPYTSSPADMFAILQLRDLEAQALSVLGLDQLLYSSASNMNCNKGETQTSLGI